MSNRFTYQWAVHRELPGRRRRRGGWVLDNCGGVFPFASLENMLGFPYWLQTLCFLFLLLRLLRPFCASFGAGYGKYLNAVSGTLTPFFLLLLLGTFSGLFRHFICKFMHVSWYWLWCMLNLSYFIDFHLCRCIKIAFSRFFYDRVVVFITHTTCCRRSAIKRCTQNSQVSVCVYVYGEWAVFKYCAF